MASPTPQLSPDILLMVAESCDFDTIMKLRKISILKPFLDKYRKSIIRNIHESSYVPTINREHILDTTLGRQREVISRDTWKSIKALERREDDIESILDGASIQLGIASKWPRLGVLYQTRLRQILKRALYRLDAVADVEASVVHKINFWESSAQWPISQTHSQENELANTWLRKLDDMRDEMSHLSCIRRQVRTAQIKYLKGLADEDLIGILVLAFMATECSWEKLTLSEYDELQPYHLVSFREALLRHGSSFLHSRSCNARDNDARHSSNLKDIAAFDAEVFEAEGDPSAKIQGLHMYLMLELKGRLEVGGSDVEEGALLRAHEMVTGTRSYAKDPPSAAAVEAKPARRGLRQKARDVLADMGSPPTTRHDAKVGKPTKNYADLGMLGSVVTAKTAHI
ncbi:hypothetical protein HJFPF1_01591 [Paramyrothecium foliicola]|nr:hypothetical protein HJFPF1_01591 [Paramyrothecium foliicola]